MEKKKAKVAQLLANLNIPTADEQELFQSLLHAARTVHRRNQADIGFSKRLSDVVTFGNSVETPVDVVEFVSLIPGHCMRFFSGLVEAFDIYQSIHGMPVPLIPSDAIIAELRQIRDFCILDGLHSIY